MAFVEILDCDFDFRQLIENIQFREIEGCVTVDLTGVTKLHKIEPTAAALTTRRYPEFATLVLEVSANVL